MNSRRRLSFLLGCAILSIGLMGAGPNRPLAAVEIGRWGTGQFSQKHPAWWWNENKCNSTAAQDAAGRKPGAKCLHVVNQTPRAPNLYGTTQQAIAVAAGQRYQITLWARAKGLASDGGVNVAVDEAWKVRPIQLPKGTYDWTRFTGTFSLPANTVQLRILSEDVGEVWIDEIRIEPAPPAAAAGGNAVAAADPVPDPQGEPEDAVWITAGGGVAGTKDAAVAIPDGAGKRAFRLRLHRGAGEQPNLDANLKVLDAKVAVEAPDAPALDKPVRLTLSFDGKLPAGVDPKRIVPVIHNGIFWEKVYNARIDLDAKRATFDVPWLGTAAIAVDQFETALIWLHNMERLTETEGTPRFAVDYVRGGERSPEPEYLRVILATLYRCHDVFVREMKYEPPAVPQIVVRVRDWNRPEMIRLREGAYRVGGISSLAGMDDSAGGIGQILITSTITDGNRLRSTVAHEYFHILQGAALRRNGVRLDRLNTYMTGDLLWLSEATAEWAVDVVFDDLNDYFRFLPRERDYTFKGILAGSRNEDLLLHPYAGAAFVKFLTWRYGKDFVRQAWKLARTDVTRNGRPETLESTLDALNAACNKAKTLDHRQVDFPTNVATFALYFNFYRNLGESSRWFRDKGSNRWLLDSGNYWKRLSLKAQPKGSLDLGIVKPLGTGPLLRLDHDKTKPLELTVRLKPYAGYSAREDTGMLLVVFADEQRILQARPFNGAGGSVKAAAKTASHLVVIPLNLHGIREFPMTLEWQTRRSPEDEVYVRGPMQVLQHRFSSDAPWSLTATQTSAVLTYFNPKTGRKDAIKFAWDVPPEKIRRIGTTPIQFTGTFQRPPNPAPPKPAPPKPTPPKPAPIDTRRTFVPGTPEKSIILNGRDEGIGSSNPDHWTARGLLFAASRPPNAAVPPAGVPAYLKDRNNFSPQHVESWEFRSGDGRGGVELFELGMTFSDFRPGVHRKRQALRLSVEEDRPVARVGFYFTGETGITGGVGRFAAAVFWDYALEEQSP